ncbi:MAG: SixA phosphatase family protein [Acidimicrobiales bacterium]
MSTFYLIRHAKAQAREHWDLPDAERPLTSRGHEQARLLASHLADLGSRRPSRIVSSEAVRCRQTVEDLSHAVSLPVVDVAWLMEGSDPAEALGRLRKLAYRLDPPSGSGGPVAACSHGDVIWAVLELLAGLGVDLGPQPDAPKAGVWIVEAQAHETMVASFFHPEVRHR